MLLIQFFDADISKPQFRSMPEKGNAPPVPLQTGVILAIQCAVPGGFLKIPF